MEIPIELSFPKSHTQPTAFLKTVGQNFEQSQPVDLFWAPIVPHNWKNLPGTKAQNPTGEYPNPIVISYDWKWVEYVDADGVLGLEPIQHLLKAANCGTEEKLVESNWRQNYAVTIPLDIVTQPLQWVAGIILLPEALILHYMFWGEGGCNAKSYVKHLFHQCSCRSRNIEFIPPEEDLIKNNPGS